MNISDQILNDMIIYLLQLVITMRHCDTITHGWRNMKVSRYESTVKKGWQSKDFLLLTEFAISVTSYLVFMKKIAELYVAPGANCRPAFATMLPRMCSCGQDRFLFKQSVV